jgi:hypothetical protein
VASFVGLCSKRSNRSSNSTPSLIPSAGSGQALPRDAGEETGEGLNVLNGLNDWNDNYLLATFLKNPSFSSSSRMLSSRYLFKLVSNLGFSFAINSKVFCSPL